MECPHACQDDQEKAAADEGSEESREIGEETRARSDGPFVARADEHRTRPREPGAVWHHREQGLSAIPWIWIFDDRAVTVDPEVERAYPGRGSFHQEVCLQCPTAECLYVCPVDAFQVEPRTMAWIIQEDV